MSLHLCLRWSELGRVSPSDNAALTDARATGLGSLAFVPSCSRGHPKLVRPHKVTQAGSRSPAGVNVWREGTAALTARRSLART